MFAALAATRFAHFAATCLLFGLVVFPFYVPSSMARAMRGYVGIIRTLAMLALATGVLELLAMAGTMGDDWRSAIDPQAIAAAVTDTAVGRVWIGRLALAAAVVGLSFVGESRRRPVLLVGAGVLLASIALTNHSAMPGGGVGMVHRAADALHLLAAGWWIGGLFALALSAAALEGDAPIVLRRFSRIGYAAVASLILTGVFKTLILVEPLRALWATAYGWVLIAKLGLFAGMGLLALSNRLQLTPALDRDTGSPCWRRRLRVQVTAELGLGVLVLAIVGVLGAMEPPFPS